MHEEIADHAILTFDGFSDYNLKTRLPPDPPTHEEDIQVKSEDMLHNIEKDVNSDAFKWVKLMKFLAEK